jgi:uncharacterized protein YxjI
MKQESNGHSGCFVVLGSNGDKKYKVLCKDFQLGKCFFLLDNSQVSLALIRKLAFPFISVYLIKFGLREISLMENRFNRIPTYFIRGIDWHFKNGLKPYSFSVVDGNSESIMSQFKESRGGLGNYEIEIFKDEFEIVCLCISVCVNNLLINDGKICELT